MKPAWTTAAANPNEPNIVQSGLDDGLAT